MKALKTAYLILFGLLITPMAIAQQGQITPSDAPIHYKADFAEYDQNTGVSTLIGNVEIVQGQMTLTADKLEIHQNTDTSGATDSTDVQEVRAFGNVKVISPEETAQGDTGVYSLAQETVILTGNVKLTRDENVLTGQQLVVQLDTGISRIQAAEGAGGGRVQGVLRPRSKEQ